MAHISRVLKYKGLTGGKVIYKKLLEKNVKNAFIYSGGSIMPVIDAFYNGEIKYYINSHEQNCGHAATGYAKTSNQTGVAIVTSGPGITNMVTPMLDAKNDSVPLVVLSGQVSKSAIGSDAFQEAPATEITKAVTKWNYCVDNVSELPDVLDYAFEVANHRKKGPVHIDLPKCVTTDIFDQSCSKEYPELNYNFSDNLDNIEKVASLINNANKPILYIGQGCIDAYYLLRKMAIEGNIPVTTTIHGNGVFDENHDLSLRWCGMHGFPASNYALQESDCIIAIGSRFDDRTTGNIEYYAPKAIEAGKKGTGGIIHVDIEPSQIGKVINTDYSFCTTSSKFLTHIIPLIKYNSREDWIKFINNKKEEHPFEYIRSDNLLMENVLERMNELTQEKDVIFTTGVGNHQMQTYQFIKSQYPKKIISSGSLGVMGAGLPYAIGAQIANKDKMVINIDGDSSFNMTLTDLKTIKENNLPIKIAVMNNSAQMMVTIWEKLFFEERYTATLNKSNPNFTKIAEAYGLKSLYCDKKEDLDNVLEEFINSKDSILCEFKIEPGICLPLVGPGKALDDMILFKEYSGKTNLSGLVPS